MKQNEVVIGKDYLLGKTDVQHRKFMEGTVVVVIGKESGSKKYFTDCFGIPRAGKNPMRFKLSNGHKCGAGELKEIPANNFDRVMKLVNAINFKP